MTMLVNLCVGVLLLGVGYFYKWWTRFHNFWNEQNIPYIKAKPIISYFWKTGEKEKPLHLSEKESYETYGRIYGRYDGRLSVLTIGEPKILEYVLLKDFDVFQSRRDMKFHDPIMDNTLFILEGSDWNRVRPIVTRAFTVNKIKIMLPILNRSCDFLVENLLESANKNGTFTCQEQFERFVLHSIGTCAFGMDMKDLQEPNNDFIKHSQKLFQETGGWRTTLTTVCPGLMKFFRFRLLNPVSTEFYKDVVIKTVEERLRSETNRTDFLQMILDAEEGIEKDSNNNSERSKYIEESDGISTESQTEKPIKDIKKKRKLSHDEVLSQCITFFIAGFDATTTLLSNAVYHLATNPDYQEKAYREMTEVLENYDKGEMRYEALKEMKLLDALLKECMRMVPAMARSERKCHRDYVVNHGDQKVLIKKDMLVSIPVYPMHYDPEIYPDPHAFKPERFFNHRASTDFSLLAFSEGKRKCVAHNFVDVWVKLCLARILSRFEVFPAPSTPASLEIIECRNVLRIGTVEVALRDRLTSHLD